MDAPLGRDVSIPLEASPSPAATVTGAAAGAAEEKPPKDKKAKQERKRREAAELIASSATSEAMQRVLGNSDLVALIIQTLVIDVTEFNRLKAVSKVRTSLAFDPRMLADAEGTKSRSRTRTHKRQTRSRAS